MTLLNVLKHADRLVDDTPMSLRKRSALQRGDRLAVQRSEPWLRTSLLPCGADFKDLQPTVCSWLPIYPCDGLLGRLERSSRRKVHLPWPGSLHCQNVHPLIGWLVMLIAAAEGLSKRLPLRTRAPSATRAR